MVSEDEEKKKTTQKMNHVKFNTVKKLQTFLKLCSAPAFEKLHQLLNMAVTHLGYDKK